MGRYLGGHFARVAREEVERWLDSVAERDAAAAAGWWFPRADHAVLQAWVDDREDWEPDDRARIDAALGTADSLSLGVRVGGWTDGRAEVEAFVVPLLRRFGGVATHEDDDHAWTLEEIEGGARVGPRRFFEPGPLEP